MNIIDEKYIEEEELQINEYSSCWEVKVDKKQKKIFFLVDGQEIAKTALRNFPNLSYEKAIHFINLMKSNNFDILKKEAKIK